MDVLSDEVESLEAILMDDVKITKNSETGFPDAIETTIFGDNSQQCICLTLIVMPSPNYPDISPKFELQKPRGLDDRRLLEIERGCSKKLKESLGYPVVFDLIEIIKEHLTESNLPSGQCVVCLYGFQEGDQFSKTECFHYLHSFCLVRHIAASRKNYDEEQDKLPPWQQKLLKPFEAVCPVCREAIQNDIENLLDAPPPRELEQAPTFHLTDELRNLQVQMSKLFLRQQSRGGIIDINAEENNIISIEPDNQSGENSKNLTNPAEDRAVARPSSETSGSCETIQTRPDSSRISNRCTSRANSSSTNPVQRRVFEPAGQFRNRRGRRRHHNYPDRQLEDTLATPHSSNGPNPR